MLNTFQLKPTIPRSDISVLKEKNCVPNEKFGTKTPQDA